MRKQARRCVSAMAVTLLSILTSMPTRGQATAPAPTRQTADLERAAALTKQVEGLIQESKFDEAMLLAKSALAIRERVLGGEHVDVAKSLTLIATLHRAKGDLVSAERLYHRVLRIVEQALGMEHVEYARALNNLGTLDIEKGDYVQAESRLTRVLDIYEKTVGPDHLLVAVASNNLGELYKKKGDLVQSVRLHQRALAIREKALGPEHILVARSLNNLAGAYDDMGAIENVEGLYKRSLKILEKELGTDHPDVAVPLNNLATLYAERGDLASAEPLLRRSLEITEKAFGSEHPEVATALFNLAGIYRERGDYTSAEPLFIRSLEISENALGPEHPDVAEALSNLSGLYMAKNEPEKALATQTRANEIRERNLALILAVGSEDQKRLYMQTLSGETDGTVSLLTRYAPTSPEASRLALTTVLRRKGRVLDVFSNSIGALRRRMNAEDRMFLKRLFAARENLATLVLQGPQETPLVEHQMAATKIENEIERLEAIVSQRNPEYRAQSQPISLDRVQQAIPAGTTLVEIVLYSPYLAKEVNKTLAKRQGVPSYVAFVLRREGAPQWVELGEAAAIDKHVSQLRTALADPRSANVKQLARALDEQVMRPVRRLLVATGTVFLSPDGALNLIPFGALVDEQERYLIESYSFTYLTSGRDLLRLRVKLEGKQETVVVADPAFDSAIEERAPAGAADKTRGGIAASLVGKKWGRLEGTANEAKALKGLFPNARVLTDIAATEAAVKRLERPRILHIATHGFFLPDEFQGEATMNGRRAAMPDPGPAVTRSVNPMLRSGLILAGANKRESGVGENGVLTALEAAGLDLWGTKLVVLSACETGVGEVRNGEGVYGLRRALVLAGSESQVMSLWQIRDTTVIDLMAKYYIRLKAGEGRTEALRQVQLGMLYSPAHNHPYFWASFIQSGAWTAIREFKARVA